MGESPSAFPYAVDESTVHGQSGMALRDWFAGQIAASLCSATDNTGMWTGLVDNASGYSIVAARSYRMADALLAEREKSNG